MSVLLLDLFDLLLKRSNSLFQSGLLFLGFFKQLLGGVELRLVHRLDVRRLLAPLRLQLLEFVAQTTILRLQETNLLDVARKPLVQVLNTPQWIMVVGELSDDTNI